MPGTGVHLDIPDALIDRIADRVAERIGRAPNPDAFLTVPEAAEVLRCERKRVYDLTSQRRLGFVKDGTRTLIRRSAIEEYLGKEAR